MRSAVFFGFLVAILFFPGGPAAQPSPMPGGPTVRGVELLRHQWGKSEGLPDWKVITFMQDSRGLMWISFNTGDELFTFDGYQFRAVKSANAPGKGRIVRLAEDLHGNIWMIRMAHTVATIDVLDPSTETIRPLHTYLALPQPLEFDAYNKLRLHNVGGRIWIGSDREVYRYDGTWKKVFSDKKGSGQWWFPTKDGLFFLEKKNVLYLLDAQAVVLDSFVEKGFDLRQTWLDSGLRTWGAYSKPGQTAIDHYCRLDTRGRTIAIHRTRDASGSGWVNDQDIFTRPPHRSKFIAHSLLVTPTPEGWHLGLPRNPLLLNLSRLYPDSDNMGAFYFDRSNGFWSNNPNGLSRFVLRPTQSPFKTLLQDPFRTYSMRGMIKKDGLLYALSYSGTKRINLATGQSSPLAYPGDKLGYAFFSEPDTLWIGIHERVVALPSGGKPKEYPIQDGLQPVFALHRSPTMGLLACTEKGLYRLNPNRGIFERTPFSGQETYLFHEKPEGLWVGTANGLFLLDAQCRIKRKAMKAGPQAGNVRVQHLYEDSDGSFWIATRGAGLLHWDAQTGRIEQYDTQKGMPHNNIHAVYPDSYGFLWLPSDKGLVRFQKSSGFIQTFYKSDGLADDEFNLYSHYQDQDGTLFFGGINGITFFHPKEVPAYTGSQQPLYLVEAHSFNLKSGTSFVQAKNATPVQTLVLKPKDTYLDLNVSPFLYQADPSVQYAWKFEGFNQNWVVQASPQIRLYNLPYGLHTLLIRYHNPGDTWPSPTLKLQIQVIRPFFLRLPFFLLVGLAVIGIARWYSYRRNRQLRSTKLQLEAEVQRRTLQVEENMQVISRQAQELRSLDELKSRFFTNVTHELRTPLTLIIGPVERLINGASLPGKAVESLHIVQRNAQKLLDLVEELLDLSKMESQKLALDEKPLALYAFVSRLFGSFAPYAEHRNVRFIFHYECPHDLTIWADGPKLEKVISNLLSNALKFTPSSGRIVLAVYQEGEALRVEVTDTGTGIAPEDLPHIFDRYYQSKRPKDALQGGTGIGLSLCKEYARLFGGSLEVQSAVGKGSAFTFVFPLRRPPLAPSVPRDEATAANGQNRKRPGRPSVQPKEKGPTLLIVEDDYNLVRYIQSILENDYHIVLADNGVSALRQLKQHTVELILSDVMMPEMDGFQLLEAVRQQGLDIPFVFLTARIDSTDRMQALRMGVDDYLTKPFLEEELRVRLRNLLERQAVRKATKEELAGQEDEDEALSYDQRWFARLNQVMNDRFSDPDFSVIQMAAEMNTSQRTLQYRTKIYTGLSPVNYLTEFRLDKARQLLEAHTYQTIAEVSFAVGFKTPRYFGQLIKRRYGKNPSDF